MYATSQADFSHQHHQKYELVRFYNDAPHPLIAELKKCAGSNFSEKNQKSLVITALSQLYTKYNVLTNQH